MFAVRVVPIARGVFKDELTFFSREPLSEGAIVPVPVRGRRVPALVLSAKDVREEKADIRSADFALKKLSAEHAKRVFSVPFIESVEDTALWHGAHRGVVLAALTSRAILASTEKLKERTERQAARAEGARTRSDLVVLQAEREERVRTYRNLAREAFARGASLLVLAPTVIEAETLAKELERGIEERVVLLTGEVPEKRLVAAWNRCVVEQEPLLVVGTAFALSAPRDDFDTVVVERESARAYRTVARPHADIRRAAEFFCRRAGARLLLGDFPLRIETRYRVDAHEMEELARSQTRPLGSAEVVVVDARKKDELRALDGDRLSAPSGSLQQAGSTKRMFRTLTKSTLQSIGEELRRGGRVAVFAARRGIAPLTVCNDCGTPVADKETGTPMTLHKTGSGNVFLSHRSGATIPAGAPCRVCGGWNLVTLGVGVEGVAEELKRAFAKTALFVCTKETAPTHRSAKKITEQFYATKGALLVGTERMLPYLTEPVERAVVASVDSFLSLSAWRAHEQTLSILFYLRERSELLFTIETRKPEHIVMQTIVSGNPLDFYRSDIEERERYGYPPFSTFIGITVRGARAAVEKHCVLLAETFADLDLVGPLSAVHEGKNMWSAKAVLRLPARAWPDRALAERLRTLPPAIEVAVDPDEIA